MKKFLMISTFLLSLHFCSFAHSQESSITSPTQNQTFAYGVTSIAVEGTITLEDSVATLRTTWPTGQVTTATVAYGQGTMADQWMVINSRTNGAAMYVGSYKSELVNFNDEDDVWDTKDYEVLPPCDGGPIIEE